MSRHQPRTALVAEGAWGKLLFWGMKGFGQGPFDVEDSLDYRLLLP